jgi:hypothetical protein
VGASPPRSDRLFEVGGEQAHIELPEALGLHMPLQGTGVQSSPQRPFGQLGARPGERRDPFGDLVTRRQQVLGWHLPRHQADPFGLLGATSRPVSMISKAREAPIARGRR